MMCKEMVVPLFNVISQIPDLAEGNKKKQENFNDNIQYSDQESNSGYPKYKAREI
jgi:hypothetical protein